MKTPLQFCRSPSNSSLDFQKYATHIIHGNLRSSYIAHRKHYLLRPLPSHGRSAPASVPIFAHGERQAPRAVLPIVCDMSTRILWLGLDGADESTLGRMLRTGRMPVLQRALSRGTVAPLRSTALPITPAAWVAMYTGMNPGKTGILTWKQASYAYDPPIVTHDAITRHALHRRLADAKRSFASIGFPITSPLPDTSFVLAGWDAPANGPICNDAAWVDRLSDMGYFSEDEFSTEKDSLVRNLRARFRIARELACEKTWDCIGLFFSFIDHLGHRLGAANEVTDTLLEITDAELGTFLASLPDEPVLLVNSDHGFGTFERAFSITQWLASRGYLALRSSLIHKTAEARGLENVNVRMDIDWNHSRAFCVDAIGSYAAIRVNTATLLPAGTVHPRDVTKLSDMIRDDLLATTTETGDPLVANVWRREELFWGPMTPYLPELIVECVPDTVALVGKWKSVEGDLHLDPHTFVHQGTYHSHRPAGIWGSSFSCVGELSVEDVAATIYGLLDLPLPADVDGTDRSGRSHNKATSEPALSPHESNPYTPDEEETVRRRLEALGYL